MTLLKLNEVAPRIAPVDPGFRYEVESFTFALATRVGKRSTQDPAVHHSSKATGMLLAWAVA